MGGEDRPKEELAKPFREPGFISTMPSFPKPGMGLPVLAFRAYSLPLEVPKKMVAGDCLSPAQYSRPRVAGAPSLTSKVQISFAVSGSSATTRRAPVVRYITPLITSGDTSELPPPPPPPRPPRPPRPRPPATASPASEEPATGAVSACCDAPAFM